MHPIITAELASQRAVELRQEADRARLAAVARRSTRVVQTSRRRSWRRASVPRPA